MIVTVIGVLFVWVIAKDMQMPTWKKVVSTLVLGVVCGVLANW